ncbi:MAG TPA: DUF3025 domain-containing protein [Ramlibacter sp.]|uniref:DUF3025 domain-containing protein n=1 Tax=Ramlibacter sp. TaxID=1917967 RepID=UPI002B8765F0|nr:DUF3025 domain-containing protein [Ramlibacter sp.]HVZ45384.1 DUF3025 domain-containing protein [Ramlibacter sp.]
MIRAIDWTAPWFLPWRDSGQAVAHAVAREAAVHDALNAQGTAPVRFVAASELPPGAPYELHIFRHGTCPTRGNLHDFFNGLVWLRFARSKQALNRLQAEEIVRSGVGARRGPVRDAITIFDENGALLHAPAPLWEALRAREWHRVFVELRPLWRKATVTVFGHALLEQLAAPRKNLTAHVWCADAPGQRAELDAWLADRMKPEALAAKPFTPLPVLGVPGWWPGNADESFYDDPLVFRPPPVLKQGLAASSVAPGEFSSPTENP